MIFQRYKRTYTFSSTIFALILALLFALLPSITFAQLNEPTFFEILRADATQPGSVDLWLYGDGFPGNWETASVEVTENDNRQSIIGDRIEPSAIQLSVVIDPWQINEIGAGGETSLKNVAAILRSLAEKPETEQVLIRLQDRVAAYSSQPDGTLQTIQDWSDEPNLLYNSVVLTPIATVQKNDLLTSLLLQSMATFEADKDNAGAESVNKLCVKTILLFANPTSQLDVAQVVAQANQQGIHIHVVDLQSESLSGESAASNSLQQLATQTQGHFVSLPTEPGTLEAAPAVIWRSLAAYHNQRHLAYLSDDTASKEIVVSLQADAQTTLRKSIVVVTSLATATDANQSMPDATAPESIAKPAQNDAPALTLQQSATDSPDTNQSAQSVTALPVKGSLPANGALGGGFTSGTAYVTIPGLDVSVPRILLILALPVLLVLLAMLIYREARERKKHRPSEYQLSTLKQAVGGGMMGGGMMGGGVTGRGAGKAPAAKPNSAVELFRQAKSNFANNQQSEPSIPLRPTTDERRAAFRSSQTAQSYSAPEGRTVDEGSLAENGGNKTTPMPSPIPTPMHRRSTPAAAPGIERTERMQQALADDFAEDDDLATVASLNFSDDEATYRLRESVEQPIIGKLIRVTNNPNLPQQLPIYGLAPAIGQSRQIHIGRHSKNNTVVISDKAISREHAVLIQKEGRLYLSDNASSAGTYLNGRRLQPGEELLLRHNDLVGFGDISYEFHAKGEDEATIANP